IPLINPFSMTAFHVVEPEAVPFPPRASGPWFVHVTPPSVVRFVLLPEPPLALTSFHVGWLLPELEVAAVTFWTLPLSSRISALRAYVWLACHGPGVDGNPLVIFMFITQP